MEQSVFVLSIVRGQGAGAQMIVGSTSRIVGRGRDADFVVLDPRVSRRHLRVTGTSEGARVEVLDGAASLMTSRGVEQRDVRIGPGDAIVIGDTALALQAVPPSDASATDVRLLMTGLHADLRGLGAAMDLVEALDGADDDGAILGALRTWGERHLRASDATFAHEPPVVQAKPGYLLERPGASPEVTHLSSSALAPEAPWFTFACETRDAPITDTTRRLVAIAARLAGASLARVRTLQRVKEERESFRRAALGSARSFLGDSAAAREIEKLVARLAASETVVLLEGETGVGKTFLARLLHESGPRATEPLRIINCAAIPESLIESELFGHERGAFTGASAARPGAFEAAGRGTVVLDEIGELPLVSQAKLLRVLEEKRFERLGSNRSIRLDARVLVATNRDLAAEVEGGTFRRDLYYRIAVVKLRVPSLRERGEDLILLARQILQDLGPSSGRRVEGFSPAALEAIRRYAWPGNVRELRNAIERALVVGDGSWIQSGDLPDAIHGASPVQPDDAFLVRLPLPLDQLEDRAIDAALKHAGGNQRRAAALLGISRLTLHRRLRVRAGVPGA